MSRFKIIIYDVRPSGHKLKAYEAEFGCVNSTNHKKDILKFLKQLETKCPACMKSGAQLTL